MSNFSHAIISCDELFEWENGLSEYIKNELLKKDASFSDQQGNISSSCTTLLALNLPSQEIIDIFLGR